MVSDYKELLRQMREYHATTTMYHPWVPKATAAIESQAREIAELGRTIHTAWNERDSVMLERDALRSRAEAAERAIKEHNDGCVAACEARQRGDYGQDCSAWISRKRRCLDCARDSMIDYPAAIAAGGDDAKD